MHIHATHTHNHVYTYPRTVTRTDFHTQDSIRVFNSVGNRKVYFCVRIYVPLSPFFHLHIRYLIFLLFFPHIFLSVLQEVSKIA